MDSTHVDKGENVENDAGKKREMKGKSDLFFLKSINSKFDVEKKDLKGRNSLLGTAFNLTATSTFFGLVSPFIVVGAGIVSFPFGFKSTGIISGFLLIVGFTIMSMISLRILFMSIHYAPKIVHSYEELAEVYFGKIMKKFCEAVMFVTLFSPLVTFLCIIGDAITPFMEDFIGENSSIAFLSTRTFIISSVSVVIIFPLSLFRSLYALRYTSVLGVFSVVYLIFLVVVTSIVNVAGEKSVSEDVRQKIFINTDRYLNVFPQFIIAIPIYAFTFCCHMVCVPIYNELKNVSLVKLDIVSSFTYGFVFFGYLFVGFFGFFMFGDSTCPDILVNYSGTSVEASFGRVCMAMCGVFQFPIIASIQRASVNSVFFRKSTKETDSVSHVAITFVVFVLNLMLALILPDISVIFGFTASLGMVMITYGFPSLFSWKLARRKEYGIKKKLFFYVMAVFLACLSIFMMVIGPVVTVFKITSEQKTIEL